MKPVHQVFVYGTLKCGFPIDITILGEVFFKGYYRAVEAYPLVIGGRWFSPYLIAEPGQGLRVRGEVYEVDETCLAMLDCLEGTQVINGYHRIRLKVTEENVVGYRSLKAWTYVKERKSIKGIHSEPMVEYSVDPRYVVPANREEKS